MWYDEAVVYQIYPLGLCGAPLQNDGDQSQADNHRILRVLDWVEHIKAPGRDLRCCSTRCLRATPTATTPGITTRSTAAWAPNEDFKQVCAALHAGGHQGVAGRRVQPCGARLLGVPGRAGKAWDSPYKDWFHISFDGNTDYNDGFWYEAWEGCNELVKLNLQNPAVSRLPV